MLLAIYPYSPVTNNHKRRTNHFISDNHRSHRRNTQTSWLSSNVTSSTKLTLLYNKTPNYVTMAAPESTPISELEKKRKRGFWFRKWDSTDITHICLIVGRHVLGCCAPFVFDWGAFWVAVVLGIFTGFGITLGYHRLLTHRSFKIPKWLEYFFVYCGAFGGQCNWLFGHILKMQNDPIFWVSVHKNHHKHVDTKKDPHTPMEGFWFSHMGWFCYNDYIATKCGESRSGKYSNVPELKAQWFYRFLHETYIWHQVALAALLYLHGGFPYLAWGMGMREVVVNHFTLLVNSACHMWGKRPWNTPDTSTNNWWVAMLTLGEGWHNNHHAFPKSSRHGLKWWQFDLTWELIKLLEIVGLATDVKVAIEADKTRMALR